MRRHSCWLKLFCTTIYLFSAWRVLSILLFSSKGNDPESAAKGSELAQSSEAGGGCEPREHVYLLKGHECGAATLQTVLFRFGLQRRLNFVLPRHGIYVGYPHHLHPQHIEARYKYPLPRLSENSSDHFDIFAVHSRFSADGVARIMPRNTLRITILRPPVQQFRSMFENFDMGSLNIDFEKSSSLRSFDSFINLPFHIMLKEAKSTIANRTQTKYGINQMSFDLGLNPNHFNKVYEIQKFIKSLSKDFTLVLMSEFMEASLVLLAELMCWPLEDVRFLSTDAPPTSQHQLTRQQVFKLESVNLADTLLYQHFRGEFEERVLRYGEERMAQDIARLQVLNLKLFNECINTTMSFQNFTPTANNSRQFNLKINAPQHCELYGMNENQLVDYVKQYQTEKYNNER